MIGHVLNRTFVFSRLRTQYYNNILYRLFVRYIYITLYRPFFLIEYIAELVWNVLDRTNTISIEISCVNDVSGNRECLRPLTALNQSSDYTIKTITIQNDTLLQRESIVVRNNRVWTKIQYFSFFFRLFASCLTLFSTHSVLCKSVKVSETLARLTSICYTWKGCFWAKSVCSNIIPIVHAGSGSVSRLRDKRRAGGT